MLSVIIAFIIIIIIVIQIAWAEVMLLVAIAKLHFHTKSRRYNLPLSFFNWHLASQLIFTQLRFARFFYQVKFWHVLISFDHEDLSLMSLCVFMYAYVQVYMYNVDHNHLIYNFYTTQFVNKLHYKFNTFSCRYVIN